MKLTREMKNLRNDDFLRMRTMFKTLPVKHLINSTGYTEVWMNKTDTILELADQIDQVTNGQDFNVVWYNLSEDYLEISIKYNHLSFYFYCREILNTLENFLHVDCKITEQVITKPAEVKTTRSITCQKEN